MSDAKFSIGRRLTTILRWYAGAVICLPHISCGVGVLPDADELPYSLREVRHLYDFAVAADMDGDGFDEVAYVDRKSGHGRVAPGLTPVYLIHQDGAIIEQINFHGMVSRPLFQDVTGDDHPELLVPFIRNDSLFLRAAGANGQELFKIFLTAGAPRVDASTVYPWDPRVDAAHLVDVDNDGRPELVTIIVTQYARLPRGVFIHSIPDGRLLDKVIVGAKLQGAIFEDIDLDGRVDLLATSIATNNGARAGGFDDSSAYLIRFDLNPLRVTNYRTMVGAWSHSAVHFRRLADGTGELLVAAFGNPRGAGPASSVSLLDPITFAPIRQRDFSEHMVFPVFGNFDRDAGTETATVSAKGEVFIIDDDFEIRHRRDIRAPTREFRALPDLNGDGIDELAIRFNAWNTLILDNELNILARRSGMIMRGSIRRGGSEAPSLLFQRSDETYGIAEWEPNPDYLMARALRWGKTGGGLLALLLPIGLLYSSVRERRLLEGVMAHIPASDLLAIMVDRKGKLRWLSRTMREAFGSNLPKKSFPELEQVDRLMPGIGATLKAKLLASREADASTDHATSENDFVSRWVTLGVRGDPHLFVSEASPDTKEIDNEAEGRRWRLMAQQVAHSIKNPLTSIMLTLNHLQRGFQRHAPSAGKELDPLFMRIGDRVEQLRELTTNFLKFVDVEAPELLEVELNDLVQDFAKTVEETLPPDIALSVKLDPRPLRCLADGSQLRAALENLTANAINAMTDGGLLTIVTGLADQIRWNEADSVRDYAWVEVRDTGTGVSPEVERRIFEAGFSMSSGGTGLGLAIVSKVAEEHGGRITVESEVGTGSVFTLYLPFHATASDERPAVP